MQLFSVSGAQLSPLNNNPFVLEKNIQVLIENNLDTLFNLELVSTEFRIDKFRLDTLAFDKQNNSFVIIEYKKGSSYSVIDQGATYLATVLRHKAECVLAYNNKTGKQLKRDNVDWGYVRLIFIAPSFNQYQRGSIDFQELPIELWTIKRYEQSLVVLEQCEAASNNKTRKSSGGDSRSIKRAHGVRHDNTGKGSGGDSRDSVSSGSQSVISEVASQIKTLSEQDHVDKLNAKFVDLWSMLRKRLEEYPGTSFHVTKGYIGWRHGNTLICEIRCHKQHITIRIWRGNKRDDTLSKGFFTMGDPKGFSKATSTPWDNKTMHWYSFLIKGLKDMDYAIFLLEQKYKTFE